MKLQVIDEVEQLKTIATEWKRLTQECGDLDNAYICYDWIAKWWECFGAGRQLHLVCLRQDNRLVGLGPFMIEGDGFCRTLRFIGFPQSNYMDLVVAGDDQIRMECVRQILEHFKQNHKWQLIDLHGFKESSFHYPLLCAGLRQSRVAFFATEAPAYFIATENQTFEEYLKFRSSVHNRAFYHIRRAKKKLGQLGEIRCEPLEPEKLPLIFKLHDKRWAKKIDTSGFSAGASRRFFTELVTGLSADSDFKTEVTALYLNRRFLAYGYGFKRNGRILMYNLAHDDDYHYFCPGRLLIEARIRDCFEAGLDFDFGVGFERYKEEWTDSTYPVRRLVLRGNGAMGWFGYGKAFVKEKSKALLKRYPQVVNFKRNTLGQVRYCIFDSVRQFKEELAKRGLGAALQGQANRVAAWVYQCETVLIGKRAVEDSPDAGGAGEFREASIEDLEELVQLTGLEPLLLIRRFYRSDKCLVWADEKGIRCGAWLSLTRIEAGVWDYSVEIPSGEACLYHYFSRQNCSGFGDIVNFAMRLLKSQRLVQLVACFPNGQESLLATAGFHSGGRIERVFRLGVAQYRMLES